MKRSLAALVVVAGVAALAWDWIQPTASVPPLPAGPVSPDPATTPPSAATASASSVPAPAATGSTPQPGVGPGSKTGPRPASPSPEPDPPPEFSGIEDPRAVADRLRQRVRNWTFEDYQALAANPQAVSGEAAYTAYQFARNCAGGITSEDQLLLRREQYLNYYQANRSRIGQEQLNRALEQLESSLVHCQGMGDEVLDAAMDWLLLSAELDYLPAMISFHQEIPQLLNNGRHTPFRRPDLVETYRQRAQGLLDRALLSGHPDAFSAYAHALRQGLAVDADPVRALAMDLVAQAISDGGLPDAVSDSELTAAENHLARMMAEDLCHRYCP